MGVTARASSLVMELDTLHRNFRLETDREIFCRTKDSVNLSGIHDCLGYLWKSIGSTLSSVSMEESNQVLILVLDNGLEVSLIERNSEYESITISDYEIGCLWSV